MGICKICGNEFVPKNWQHIYCGDDCNRQAQNIRRRKKEGEFELNCAECGKPFRNTQHNAKYCGDDCKRLARNRLYAEKVKSHVAPKRKTAQKPGKTYYLVESVHGAVINELTTTVKQEAREFYWRGDAGACCVRVYVDGVKLRFTESDKLLGRPGWLNTERHKRRPREAVNKGEINGTDKYAS